MGTQAKTGKQRLRSSQVGINAGWGPKASAGTQRESPQLSQEVARDDFQGEARPEMSLKGCVRVLLIEERREDYKSIQVSVESSAVIG